MAGERTERLDRRAASEVAGLVTTDSICHNENRWAYTVCVLIAVVRCTRVGRHHEGVIGQRDEMIDVLVDGRDRLTLDQASTASGDSGPVFELQPKLRQTGYRRRAAGDAGALSATSAARSTAATPPQP